MDIQIQLTVDEQKKVANDILLKLATIDSNVILAGGAPRDWFFGNPAQDLDIYLHGFGLESQLLDLGFDFAWREFEQLYEYESNPYLIEIYSGMYDGVNVQIMNFNVDISPEVVLKTFLLDICRVWYKDREIHTHKHFDESVSHKIIRKVGLYDNPHYVGKIVSRFPDFLFIG